MTLQIFELLDDLVELCMNLTKQVGPLLLVPLDNRHYSMALAHVFLVEDHAVRAEELLARLTKVLQLPFVPVFLAHHHTLR